MSSKGGRLREHRAADDLIDPDGSQIPAPQLAAQGRRLSHGCIITEITAGQSNELASGFLPALASLAPMISGIWLLGSTMRPKRPPQKANPSG